MERIRKFLYENNKRTPVVVPRLIRDLVTRYVTSQLPILMQLELAGAMSSINGAFGDQSVALFFRRVLVMEYIDGIPILNLGDEIAKRGINPGGKIAAAAKQ